MMPEWHDGVMSGTYAVTVGDRGRIVVPAQLRERAALAAGTRLVMLDTPGGIVLLTREHLRARVREELDGLDLVGDLLAERRHAADRDDAA